MDEHGILFRAPGGNDIDIRTARTREPASGYQAAIMNAEHTDTSFTPAPRAAQPYCFDETGLSSSEQLRIIEPVIMRQQIAARTENLEKFIRNLQLKKRLPLIQYM